MRWCPPLYTQWLLLFLNFNFLLYQTSFQLLNIANFINIFIISLPDTDDGREPTVRYRWTNWKFWKITGWTSRPQGNLLTILDNKKKIMEHTPINKENRKMSTCNRLNLPAHRSQPTMMPKNLPAPITAGHHKFHAEKPPCPNHCRAP